MSDTAATTGSTVTAPISDIHFVNKVYIVFSKWDVKKIVQHCRTYGDVLWSRLVYDKNGNETDRTLVILPDETYEGLVQDGYGQGDHKKVKNNKVVGFRIVPYILREDQEHANTRTLFVPAPKDYRDSTLAVEHIVNDKLRAMASFKVISSDSWCIDVPARSRESGEVKSGAFISFDNDLERGRIAMTRLLLNDTYWPEADGKESHAVFRCYWARERAEQPEKSDAATGDKDNKKPVANKGTKKPAVMTPEEREERRLAHISKLMENAVPTTGAQ